MSAAPRPPTALWFPFPHEVVRSGLWKKLSKGARTVFPVICTFANFETGECYPSIRTIAELAGTGTGRVLEAIEELVKAGLLIRWSGNHTQSNRYKVTLPGVSGPDTPRLPVGDTPASAGETGLSPQRRPNDIHVTTVNVMTTINNGAGAGGGPLEVGDLIRDVAGELGLKKVGLQELDGLIEKYGGEWVSEAFREAVLRGKKTLQYMDGILQNWKRQGKIVRKSKRAAAQDSENESRLNRQKEREEDIRKHEESKKAHLVIEQKLREIPDRERAILKAQAEVECDQEEVPGVARAAVVTSKIRRKVAEKFGIQGL
jgi:DnaD/phage-associated family protein